METFASNDTVQWVNFITVRLVCLFAMRLLKFTQHIGVLEKSILSCEMESS